MYKRARNYIPLHYVHLLKLFKKSIYISEQETLKKVMNNRNDHYQIHIFENNNFFKNLLKVRPFSTIMVGTNFFLHLHVRQFLIVMV